MKGWENMSKKKDLLIEIKDLKTYYFTDEGIVKAVNGVDYYIEKGKILCVVGESGCGKSVTARSILQLINKPGKIVSGDINFYKDDDTIINIAKLNPRGKKIREIRGKEISMIFQEPMTSLSPIHTIGNQIMENISTHLKLSEEEVREKAILALRQVGIPKPETRLDVYPFQLSGGMRQRAMIAMALACRPDLLIADEPTTALDVTTQANILDLIKGLQEELQMAVLFITHDLGVVAEIADNVAVMYLGEIVEFGDVFSVMEKPKHPYTKALLESIPKLEAEGGEKLSAIKGMVPHPFNRPVGCTFHPRCEEVIPGVCDQVIPSKTELEGERMVRCLHYEKKEGGVDKA